MAGIHTITRQDLSKARKGGFKRKKPKKPRQSASLTSMENWIVRYNEWCKDAKDRAKDYDKREKLKKQIRTAG